VSHIVTIQTRMRDRAALEAACRRLGLAAPVDGSYQRFDYTTTGPDGGSAEITVSGTLVKLPGWIYPVAVQPDGSALYDDYKGQWGNVAELHKLLQAYAIEATRIQARRSGRTITETPLPDGSVRLTVTEA
jgi:hypothetical protein